MACGMGFLAADGGGGVSEKVDEVGKDGAAGCGASENAETASRVKRGREQN
jgi:hypothetical protein